jgi:large subunit ribosomal protein L15
MLTLNNLKSEGATKNRKRIGRGQGSGWGTQAGKGHKGQKARSGGGKPAVGFEGGQMPIYRRLPKKGFSNARFKVEYALVNLDTIENKFNEGEVSRKTLIEKGILKGINKRRPIKVLGNGSISKKLEFKGISKFSKTAFEGIEKSGSSISKEEKGNK